MIKKEKQYSSWEREKRLIPTMIRMYCRGKHKTRKNKICRDCEALTDYARLDKCPYKVDKKFCSFCKIHCYQPEMRKKIKEVMKYSGPRMLFTHPVFAISHVVQMIKFKRMNKQQQKK